MRNCKRKQQKEKGNVNGESAMVNINGEKGMRNGEQ